MLRHFAAAGTGDGPQQSGSQPSQQSQPPPPPPPPPPSTYTPWNDESVKWKGVTGADWARSHHKNESYLKVKVNPNGTTSPIWAYGLR